MKYLLILILITSCGIKEATVERLYWVCSCDEKAKMSESEDISVDLKAIKSMSYEEMQGITSQLTQIQEFLVNMYCHQEMITESISGFVQSYPDSCNSIMFSVQ